MKKNIVKQKEEIIIKGILKLLEGKTVQESIDILFKSIDKIKKDTIVCSS